MMTKTQLILVALGSLLLGMTEASAQQKLYRWVDNEGLVHYSDHVPPAFANQDLDILNDHGIAVEHLDRAASEEELAERARLAAVKEAEDEAAREQARVDNVLLATYLSVEDIVRLRDQRLELLEAQASVTEQYLRNLTERLDELLQSAERYSPYNEDTNAPAMPDNLALDISRTTASIELYEKSVRQSYSQQANLTETFAIDIQRFRELTGT
ncbi:MAG: DUF4124 domain-containing protein [Gammaproteobacteria bacterium]|nr:DUF4124 domain-containing protein [Gammaproteobacteria bacterium]